MRTKNEAVTVSFHYLNREFKGENGKPVIKFFSQEEFDGLVNKLEAAPKIDLTDEEQKDLLRFRDVVLLENLKKIDKRTLFGVFKASYWGHEYENTDKGLIPAESISLRPFHFLLYLGSSGKIYLASQYLGQFGGYAGLLKTVAAALPNSESVRSHSFRVDAGHYKDAAAKEVKVTIAKKGQSIASANVFQQSAIIAFKKQSKDDGFEEEVSKRLLSFFGQPIDTIKKAVAAVLKENQLMDVSDEDIQDCTVVASVNGSRKVIYLMETGLFATRFPLDVPLNANGHPKYEETKQAILKTLETEIISRSEDV